MLGVEWEQGNILKLTLQAEDAGYFPVFYEELEILGFRNYWNFPRSNEPLLWGRDAGVYLIYELDGRVVAKVKKGALYKSHKIEFVEEGLNLKPIDLKRLIDFNKHLMKEVINETLDYIRKEKEELELYADAWMVSYSGGKDSQVVLDLVLEVFSPDEVFVVFTDTKMELEETYRMVEWTEEYYRKKYPNFKIHRVSSPFDTAELWELIGVPSRIKRWCCSVYKIAPQIKFIERISTLSNIYRSRLETIERQQLNKYDLYHKILQMIEISNFPVSILDEASNSPNGKSIMTFEGTRADESQIRSCLSRTSRREKTFRQINLRPIFYWTSFMVYLYHFFRGLPLNPLYRKGFRRVGCSVCPFASQWSEYLMQILYPEWTEKFLRILRNYAKNMGKLDEEEVKEYISSGAWKVRAGGIGLESTVDVEVLVDKDKLIGVMKNPRENLLEWSKTLGSLHILKETEEYLYGELRTKDNKVIDFEIKKVEGKQEVVFRGVDGDIKLQKALKSLLYKSAYCLHCTGCEIECPSFALMTYPEVRVNTSRCTNCYGCLEFINTGCYVADSYGIFIESKMKRKETYKVDRYRTFGLRSIWLEDFLNRGQEWLLNNTLGPKQKEAMYRYLYDTGLIDRDKNLTELFHILSKLFNKDRDLVWQVLWVNLCINSQLFRWYTEEVKWGARWNKKELVNILTQKGVAERTAKNSINSLTNTFENSPLGRWFGLKIEKETYEKVGIWNIQDISAYAVGYSLYKLREIKGWKGTSIRELERIKEGPIAWFGLGVENLKMLLNSLKVSGMLSADLTADLDNIVFHEDMNSLKILENALQRL